ncbi:hypothetical protein THASP1DRAFT_31128 [Thamnocephalis sphaerospora]|uniref:DUF1279 domain-containing protein n=1 Tax=Thamnocephalis sphaerospora TaxID=78915 RepID=A0A4P9XP77_9FUNG|nr:hypothetical protein THASP1DRAFT_31128 [Thamnocephalis sphaerospora]|eukprot:RKP07060.1 hypothetical protein THASP1DRAFT_31128 [Thamnocephalis sphaerospora]
MQDNIVSHNALHAVNFFPTSPAASPATSSSEGGSGKKSDGKGPRPGSIRHLLQTYGRAAFIVYMVVSTADLVLCVLGVYAAGADQVVRMEDWLHHYLPQLPWSLPGTSSSSTDDLNEKSSIDTRGTAATTSASHRVEDEAEHAARLDREWHDALVKQVEDVKRHPTLTSIFLVAYGIHELLTPVRVALTAVLTPPIARRYRHVRWLMGRQTVTKNIK